MLARPLWFVVTVLAFAPAVSWSGARASAQHQCSYCHDVHGGVNGTAGALNRDAVLDDMCLTCHSDAGVGYTVTGEGTVKAVNTASLNVTVHAGSKHAVADTTHCWDCHDHEAEAGSNVFMIPEQRTGAALGVTRAIVFTDTTTQAGFLSSDGVGGATADGVCVVCHDVAENPANTFANYDTTDGHNGPDRCVSCHTHDAGFQGAGGGCTTCHNSEKGSAPVRRIVTDDFTRASHHVTGTVTDADCEVCHDQASGHSSDSNGVLLFDHDGGASIQLSLTAAPMTVDTDAAQLETFCLGCHGDGTANGATTTPFSTAATIPTIAEATWLASSHEGAAAVSGGCFGDGAFGCHGNGHGSEKSNLLAPYATAPTALSLFEEEEGFCFGCHTNGGGATTDIDAQFDSTTINWTSEPWGISDITTFNDRHDVRYAASNVSGAKIECVNCHNPHADNSGQKYDSDPDPATTPSTWTGQTAMSAFCLDCHDGSLPTGVLDHTGGPMQDIDSVWTNHDGMGVPATGGELMNDSIVIEATLGAGSVGEAFVTNPWIGDPILECVVCHRPHPKAASEWPGTVKYDFFSLQDTVPAPDGRGIAYYEVVSSMGSSSTVIYWDYGLSEDNSKAVTEADAGGWHCNTCHDRRGMNGKSACGSGGCHEHGGKM